MREGTVFKTTQVPMGAMVDLFKTYAQKDIGCIYIAFSSELSGTYQTALVAKKQVLEEYPDFDLTIIDSKSASMGQGLAVLEAAKLSQQGAEKKQIVDRINFYIEHMEHIFTVDNLDYLKRGGRVSNASAFIGGVLNIKPILDVEEGQLVPIEKIRGRKKSINKMVNLMLQRSTTLKNQTIAITHGDDLEAAHNLQQLIDQHEQLNYNELIITEVGSVIGAHSGPGTLAVFFLNG
jgi:DegV family protein with EDD domain